MISPTRAQHDVLDHLPESLKERLTARLGTDSIVGVTPFDLDFDGNYIEGYLVLTETQLGEFLRREDGWASRWLRVESFGKATIIEGLGMSLLRLLSDGRTAEEFRFTLRHAKAVAQLQRQFARLIDSEEDSEDFAEEYRPSDAKKLRCEKCDRVIPAWAENCPACMIRRKILFRLLDFVGPYRKRTIIGVLLALMILGVSLVPPWLHRSMVNRGLGAKDGQADWSLFLNLWILWAVIVLIASIGRGIQARIMAGLGSRVSRDIRQRVYAHLHSLSLSFFGKKQTGSLVSRVTHDSDRMWDFVAFTVVEVATSILTIFGVAILLFVMNWRLAIFVLLPLPIMIALTLFFHNRLHGIFHRIWHRWSQMTAVIGDALPGVRVIKAFSQEGREIDRFEHKSGQVYDEQMAMINIWTTFGPVMQFCTQVGMLVIWLLGGWWVYRNVQNPTEGMAIGTLVAFTGYMQMFYRPIHMIAHMDRMFNRAATSAQRIFEILDTEPTIFSAEQAHAPDKVEGKIEFRNVNFSYDGIRRVLKDVNLTIMPGEMIGLAGPSGGGKTTLVNLICRFYDVQEGQILVDGVDVREYEVSALRSKIGVVLQEPFLFHGTVSQNIAYGKPDATLDEIIKASRAANAHDFITGFPDGYDTLVGERGHSLSGGERQRISIARAILDNPVILILDEATSSVDTETEKLIQEALDRLIANRTTIAIAHRLSTLRKADRLAIMEKGRLVEEGTHAELAAKADGLYAKLLRTQGEMQAVMGI